MAPQRQKVPPAPGPVRRSARIHPILVARDTAGGNRDQKPKVAEKSPRAGKERVATGRISKQTPKGPSKAAASKSSKTTKRTKAEESRFKGTLSKIQELEEEQAKLVAPTADPPEDAEATAEAANNGIAELLDRKEGDLLSALIAMAMAKRELNDEYGHNEEAQRKTKELQELIHTREYEISRCKGTNEESVREAMDAVERGLVGDKARLQRWEEEVNHSAWRFKIMSEHVVSRCHNLCDLETYNLGDVSAGAKKLKPIQSLADNNHFWRNLEDYRSANRKAKQVAQELDDLRRQRSTIAKSMNPTGKQLLGLRLASGIGANDIDSRLHSMPDLRLSREMLQKEFGLVETLKGYPLKFELGDAVGIAILVERALIDAGLLMPSNFIEHARTTSQNDDRGRDAERDG